MVIMVDEQFNDTISKWVERYDKHLTRQSEQIDALTKDVSSLTADVRTLMRNQESLFVKTSRPFQWGAFVSALGLIGIGAGLLIAPIHREIDIFSSFVKDTHDHRIADAYDMGRQQANIEWLKMLEQRENNRLHSRYGIKSE